MTVDEVLEAAKKLTDDERAMVLHSLQSDDEAALKAEIERRLERIRTGEAELHTVDDIDAHIRSLGPSV